MAQLDLLKCDDECISCIKNYKCKHKLVAGQKFEINCRGIPKYKELGILTGLGPAEQNATLSIMDPVEWAAQTLDWHCFDPDGSVWKRKNPEEYDQWVLDHPGESLYGHSRYHRPYQGLMLRCNANRKVFLIGRQAGKTESIVVSMLYHLFTKPGVPDDKGYEIVLLTPYQAQIDLIFKRMEELLRAGPATSNSIKRNVKAPIYTMTLHNKSEVRGFTAGTKSGGHADAIRGQHANMLVFDEADYLESRDMESAFAIITNYPNASVWMSSTPTGKREQFYTKCNAKDWKLFKFPSHINPMFTESVDRLFRDGMTVLAYKHEVLAEFGEQEEGVFQNSYVQAAKADYRYGSIPRNPNWTYTIGVDWNDTKIGTTIAVLGFDPMRNIFTLMDTKIVSRDGWTQLSACQKIADLNRLWQPKVIYIDAGHGGTQDEVLRKFGWDSMIDPAKGPGHPDSKLRNIVKRYDFGSQLEVHDLWTHQPIKKAAKPFLVESASRRFESHDIRISKYDESLEKQLLGYVIDRVTPTGVPVYKASSDAIGDHMLDALMLSIVGFILEVTALGKPKYTTDIAFSGKFGEGRGPEIFPGDTVIQDADKKEGREKEKVGSRPDMTRTDGMQKQNLLPITSELPGNHTSDGGQIGLWDWPGFLRDGPKPRVLTLSEAESAARKRMGIWKSRSISKPRRRNI